MTNDTNPAAALRVAMRALLSMFRETLGDQAGAAALKTAVERALSDVTGGSRAKAPGPKAGAKRRVGRPPKAKAAPAKAVGPAPAAKGKKGKKKQAKAGPPSAGRLRQIAAMKAYWRKRKAQQAAGQEAAAGNKA